MQASLCLLVALVPAALCEPGLSRGEIRDGIEGAAIDSAILAEDLAAMLDRLEDDDDDDEEEREERRGAKDLVSLELEEALRITEALASKANKGGKRGSVRRTQEERRPKKVGSSTLDSLLKRFGLDFSDEEVAHIERARGGERGGSGRSGLRQPTRQRERKSQKNEGYEEREGKELEEDKVTCETEDRDVEVKVCHPGASTRATRVQLPGQRIQRGAEWCYIQSKTVCEDKGDEGKERETCSFGYVQGSHPVAAVAVEMILDLRSERMGVTTCHHEHTEYGESKELCELHHVSQHYKLPGVHHQDLELLDMAYPEPVDHCVSYTGGAAHVACREQPEEVCMSVDTLAAHRETLQVGHPIIRPDCRTGELKQQQEVCTKEVHQKRRGYSG